MKLNGKNIAYLLISSFLAGIATGMARDVYYEIKDGIRYFKSRKEIKKSHL